MPTDLDTHHIIFSHREIPRHLTIATGANNISWAYNLNTVSYATYAGEVVQVLSCNIDNLQIDGEVRSYAKMEEIYRWFLEYMQKATQGTGGDKYVGSAVKMEYPHRGWTLYIKPLALPAMRYGREVVVPSWSMQAHIEDPDPIMKELTVADATKDPRAALADFPIRINANIGYRPANPFSDPIAVVYKEENKMYLGDEIKLDGIKVEGGDKEATEIDFKGLAKQMQDLFESLIGGEFKDLRDTYGYASKPAEPTKKKDSTSTKTSTHHG